MDENTIEIPIRAQTDGLKSDFNKVIKETQKCMDEVAKIVDKGPLANNNDIVYKFDADRWAKQIAKMKKALAESNPLSDEIEFEGLTFNKEEFMYEINETIKNLEDTIANGKEAMGKYWNWAPDSELGDVDLFGQVGEEEQAKLSFLDRIKSVLFEVVEETEEAEEATNRVGVSLRKASSEVEIVGESSKKAGEGFDGIMKKVFGIGLRLLGVVSTAQFFMRVVRSAISDNKEIENTIVAITKTLAEMLMPVIDWVARAVKSLLVVLNSFLYGLTGVNYLANAMARAEKSAKGTAKAVKSLKQLAGFDELNNMNTQTGGGGVGAGDWTSGLNPNELNQWWVNFGRKVREIIDEIVRVWNQTIWPAIKPVFDAIWRWLSESLWPWLQKFFPWFEENWTWFIPLVIDGIGAIKLAWGLATGDIGSLLSGLGLLGVGIFTGIEFGAENSARKATDSVVTSMQEAASGIINSANVMSQGVDGSFKTMEQSGADSFGRTLRNARKTFEEIDGMGKKAFGDVASSAKGATDSVARGMNKVKDDTKTSLNGTIGYFEGTANAGIKGSNSITRALNKIQFDIPSWIPIIGGKKFGFNLRETPETRLARLDVGTNYVPQDQLAYIHKGEAVIPKKYNNNGFVNGTEVTNQLLEAIVEAVRDIDVRPQIQVTEVGKANDRYAVRMSRQLGVV